MGILGDLLNHAATSVGEIGRIYRTQKEEEKRLTDEDRKQIEMIVQGAENGNIDCMKWLAEAYWHGTELRYDPDQYCYWTEMAAKAGDRNSMYNLGMLYLGEASTQFYDSDKALYWLSEAAKRGDADAKQVIEKNYKYSYLRDKWVRK